MKLKVKRLLEDALLPTKKYPGDAGYDLYANGDYWLSPGEELVIPLGFAIEIPDGYVGIIKEKGGTEGLIIGAGIIDSNYRGELKLRLRNFSSELYYTITFYNKIAQLLILPCPDFEVEEIEELSETERGEKGGINK